MVFWGWQAALLAVAIPMAVAYELARFSRWRLNLTDTDFNRIADLTAVGLLVVVVYQFDANLFHERPLTKRQVGKLRAFAIG